VPVTTAKLVLNIVTVVVELPPRVADVWLTWSLSAPFLINAIVPDPLLSVIAELLLLYMVITVPTAGDPKVTVGAPVQ